jgi:hypothetical protein
MSLIFPFVGQKVGAAWLDPLGGLLLSLYSKPLVLSLYMAIRVKEA